MFPTYSASDVVCDITVLQVLKARRDVQQNKGKKACNIFYGRGAKQGHIGEGKVEREMERHERQREQVGQNHTPSISASNASRSSNCANASDAGPFKALFFFFFASSCEHDLCRWPRDVTHEETCSILFDDDDGRTLRVTART